MTDQRVPCPYCDDTGQWPPPGRMAREYVESGPRPEPEVRFVGITFPHPITVEHGPGTVTIRRADLDEVVAAVEADTRRLMP